jgi:TolB protein
MADPAIFAWFPSGEVRRISPPVGYYAHPSVHPDGERAVFWGGAFGTPGVWRTDLGRGKASRLTSMASGSWHPSFGARGDAIVFVSDRFGDRRSPDMREVGQTPGRLGLAGAVQAHVFTMQIDGRGVRQVTTGAWYDQRPSFSPGAERIAFISNRGGRPGIWVVAAAEHAEPRALAADVTPESVAWSADGATIYFTHRAQDAFEVGAVAADGGAWHRITASGAAELREPFADPDGETLLVDVPRDGGWGLAELRLATGATRALTPPGFGAATRGGRARNGVVVFEARDPAESAA